MADVHSFAALLHELIAQNKLSPSRVARVTDSVPDLLPQPVPLAGAVRDASLRAHPKTKLVALYLFDAIARHAQDIARRRGEGVRSAHPPAVLAPAAADFLRALQDVAVPVGTDALRGVPPEQREKVLKVIDIWSRAGTFDAQVLRQIQEPSAPEPAP